MKTSLKIIFALSVWLFCRTVMAVNPPTTNLPGNGGSPGTTVSSLTPIFSWNPVSGATGYGLYIRDMTAPGTPLIYPNASGTTAVPLNGTSFSMPAGILVAGHVYRWNMTSFTGSTEGSGVSGVLYFQTPTATITSTTIATASSGNTTGTIAINPPSAILPGNSSSPGAMVSSLTPIFSWSPVSGATGYGLYIRDMTAAGTPLIYPNAGGLTARPLTGSSFTMPAGILTNGHTYRWNMTSFNGSTESTTVSSALYFQTPAGAPAPTTTVITGSGTVAGTAAISPPTTSLPGTGSSPGTLVNSLMPTFSWNPVSGASGYGLYIRDMTAAGTPLIYPNTSGITAKPITGTAFAIPSGVLANSHVYRWNMTSFNGSTESTAVSGALYFQTPAGTPAPTTTVVPSGGNVAGTMAISPPMTSLPGTGSSPGTLVNSLTPTFSWNPASGATGYGLYIRDMTATGTPLIYPNASGTMAKPLTGNSFLMPAGILVAGHVYRWNMTSFNGSTESTAVSSALYFQTPAGATASTTTVAPGSGAVSGTAAVNPVTAISSGNSTPSGKMPFDTVVGSFNGVTAYSNGSVEYDSGKRNDKNRPDSGIKWQCVEFVRRYYSDVYGMNIGAGENASGIYSKAASWKLASFPNGGTVSPQVGDIICFGGGSSGNGHVAIITGVSSTQITVIQQNVTESSRDAAFPCPMSVVGGKYTVYGTTIGSSYNCQGWLRKPVVGVSPSVKTPQQMSTTSAANAISSKQTPASSQVQPNTPAPQSVRTCVLKVEANPSNGGTVSGGGAFASDSSQTVTATANKGYVFVGWMEKWQRVNQSAQYQFKLNGNRTLIAHFRRSVDRNNDSKVKQQ